VSRRAAITGTVIAMLLGWHGCARSATDGPPDIRLGETVCDDCGMIVSDDRFATATIIEGDRGPEARVFDDFSCQVNYESAHPDLTIVARWSHDYETHQWLSTETAAFLRSPPLRTPMASQAAAFKTRQGAESTKQNLGGDVMDFESLWQRLAPQAERDGTP
jgi:copper chaperone NosL